MQLFVSFLLMLREKWLLGTEINRAVVGCHLPIVVVWLKKYLSVYVSQLTHI